MIGRLYMASIGAETHSLAETLMEIAAASDMVCTIERMWNSQSDFDTSENLNMKVEDVATTGTYTSTVTPTPLQAGDAAATATVKQDATIEPIYAGSVYIEQGFNVLSGWLWTPANDDEVIVVSPSQLVAFRLDAAPSTGMAFSYGLTFREIGG